MNEPSKQHPLEPLIIDLPLDRNEYFQILDDQKAVTMRSGLVTLKPDEDVGSHNTENFEEFIIILEGSGEIEIEGSGKKNIHRGQVAYNPPHTQHNVINTGEAIMRYIYIISKTAP